ncbi:hypothetical protein ACERII_07085 [Evansella sp. AB-rgal1]|uniref:hypothetical protein n=1 Tax=Evansella sp. AB-rgal1 TaxID=3242696 RepID=UPI00359E022A
MIPSVLITLAWVFIAIRCGVRFVHLLNRKSQDWLEMLFQFSVVLIALSFLL